MSAYWSNAGAAADLNFTSDIERHGLTLVGSSSATVT